MPSDPDRPPAAPPPRRPARPVVIGLTGGVAAGKSTVAKLFADRGFLHVDADAEARVVSAEPDVLAAVAAAFGPAVTAGGRLDRAALARIVFADPAARARLEGILHPRIRARIRAALDAALGRGQPVLVDAPLLLETGLVEFCDLTVHVDAGDAVRRARAAARGWGPDELDHRERAQLPVAVKRARAFRTIANDGDLEDTARAVAAVIAEVAASRDASDA